MLKTSELLKAFGRSFPKRLAKPYSDYVGLMCGKLPINLEKIAVVLDMEPILIEPMLAEKPDLILTHHPFIYGSKATVLKRDLEKKRLVETLEKHHLPVYSLHTNFDAGQGGMNDALANQLNLIDVTPLQGDPLARGGKLAHPMMMHTFAQYVKERLNVPYVHYLFSGNKRIEKVAIIGGGGAKYFTTAQAEGYDVFISGDSAHHTRRQIINAHFNYIEVAHEVEIIFIPIMAAFLKNLDPTIKVVTRFKQAFPQLV